MSTSDWIRDTVRKDFWRSFAYLPPFIRAGPSVSPPEGRFFIVNNSCNSPKYHLLTNRPKTRINTDFLRCYSSCKQLCYNSKTVYKFVNNYKQFATIIF